MAFFVESAIKPLNSETLCLRRLSMRAVSICIIASLCQLIYYKVTYAAGKETFVTRCNPSGLATGALCTLLFTITPSFEQAILKPGTPVPPCTSQEVYLPSAGPNELQVAEFRTKLSNPTALNTQFSYHYSASLITDGLANGTDPVYVYTMPRCNMLLMAHVSEPAP